MVLVDAQDRRVVLIELRLYRDASPSIVRRRFNRMFRDVFGTTGPPQPVPMARHYMRCRLTPDEITQLVCGGDADGQRGPCGFQAGCFCSLDANTVIRANQSPFSGAHSDIEHPEVLWAVVDAADLGA
jgi:hypothetical protein